MNSNYKGDQNDRTMYMLISMLNNNGYIRVADFAEKLYVSNRQVSNDLAVVREYIQDYNLGIESVPHRGMRIIGSEFHKRLCLADLYNENPSLLPMLGETNGSNRYSFVIERVYDIVTSVLKQKNIQISDNACKNLVMHLFIAILRIQTENFIDCDVLEEPKKTLESEAVEQIVSELEQQFQVRFSSYERNYATVHLKGKRNYSELNDTIPPEVSELVKAFLEQIDGRFGTDFRSDFTLCMMLNVHFAPLIERLKYGLKQKNPLLDEIRTNYVSEFEMAQAGAEVINQMYHCQLSDDEICYLALYLRLTVEKRLKDQKYKILLVCPSGRGTAELMRVRFTAQFEKYIGELKVTSVQKLSSLALDEYDCIFSTVPLSVETSTPVIGVSSFLDQKDVSQINDLFNYYKLEQVFALYFHDELFIQDLEADSREEVLQKMIAHINCFFPLPEGFYASVLEREASYATSYGNNVAFPHPLSPMTSQTLVAFATLKRPILWGKKKVKLVIMTSIETNRDRKLDTFYEMVTAVIGNRENVKRIIEDPCLDTLRQIILNH